MCEQVFHVLYVAHFTYEGWLIVSLSSKIIKSKDLAAHANFNPWFMQWVTVILKIEVDH